MHDENDHPHSKIFFTAFFFTVPLSVEKWPELVGYCSAEGSSLSATATLAPEID